MVQMSLDCIVVGVKSTKSIGSLYRSHISGRNRLQSSVFEKKKKIYLGIIIYSSSGVNRMFLKINNQSTCGDRNVGLVLNNVICNL